MAESSVLIVDDEIEFLRTCARVLRDSRLRLVSACGWVEALEKWRATTPDAAVVDLDLPGESTVELVRRLRLARPGVPIAVLAPSVTPQFARAAVRSGADDFVAKPIDAERFPTFLLELVGGGQDDEPTLAPGFRTADGRELAGSSPNIVQQREFLARICGAPTPALFVGESGTGRLLACEVLHALSPRAGRPLVIVDAAALSTDELLGNDNGPGCLHRASEGTLVIRNLHLLQRREQAVLAAVFESGRFRRVGGSGGRSLTARLLATAAPILDKKARAGEFLPELYARFCALRFDTASVRTRIRDLRPATVEFLRRAGQDRKRLSAAAWAVLGSHQWPGNFRELESVIQAAVAISSGVEIEVEALQFARSRDEVIHRPDTSLPYKEAKQRWIEPFEREYLADLLRRHRGNVTYAAEAAGIDRKSIQRMMKKLRLGSEDF